jgi:hypothetical protein
MKNKNILESMEEKQSIASNNFAGGDLFGRCA